MMNKCKFDYDKNYLILQAKEYDKHIENTVVFCLEYVKFYKVLHFLI